jgi:hypothetical protein
MSDIITDSKKDIEENWSLSDLATAHELLDLAEKKGEQ